MRLHSRLLLGMILFLCPSHPAGAREIVINAVGDIMLGGSANTTLKRFSYDYPFAATVVELKQGDIAVGNLEAPIARHGIEFKDKRFRFRTDPQSATALKRAGFSIVTLANNHIMDFGAPALQETLRNLDNNGILHAGAGLTLAAARQQAVVRVKGANIAFLAYSLTLPAEFFAVDNQPGTAPGFSGYFKKDITRAKTAADYVVVSFHWGAEGATAPSLFQMATARAAIDAGADVVLGHHPHVLQGIEQYKKGIILYSLGNFTFGSRSRAAAHSVIARITLTDGVTRVQLLPLNVLNSVVNFQPRPLDGRESAAVIDHLNRISRELGTVIVNDGERFLVRMARDEQVVVQQKGETLKGKDEL
jgi:poly-gamma-glutamate capsule biosynthesis protein CapA/YwtB (metallophosphatase superfamily)